ncbi:NADH dehydrogenase (quinone) [Oscillochloris trichoides DG-6]|uniref:NADH dehydrogenase (Quinone) n=1 Tax=Oscillochloris trichoides DG-6 TaxID=765420 RepID=E1IAQ1_9CHLR|nr:hydrogen gas-evolving membrane-bound hydrogenase subunit E [Oscillochloris trichoides]EFO81730.1 NADH dehydrogenase (quinone) [Oscillochloris trichoides DG-6]
MLPAIVLITLALAPLGLLARTGPRPLVGWALALLPALSFALLLFQLPQVTGTTQIREVIPWVPAMGVELNFALDGLSLLFALVITGIGTLIIGYAGHYMHDDPGLGRFLLYLLLFMGAMLGLVLAGNVLTMFIFWELTSVTSYLLIGYKHDYPGARRGALQSLVITAGGGLALLLGLLILGEGARQAGVAPNQIYNFDAIIAAGDAIKAGPLYTPALLLILVGAFTKSAQFPFHFWLPGAMQAPTPASAFLHSATMVKAGVYLLARLAPGLGDTPLWNAALVLVGGFTFAFGALVATRKDDIKALLAYTTLSMLGGLIMLIGLGGKYAAEAVVVNILAHALYKSALFMIAGIIDHEAGSRDLRQLGGLRRMMPATAFFIALALLSQMGIPVFFGFVGKELLIEAALSSPLADPLRYAALTAIVVAAVGYIIAAWRLFKYAFLGTPSPTLAQRHHVADPRGMLVPPAIPALLSIIIPLALLPWASQLLAPAASVIYGKEIGFKLALWHGVNSALMISSAAILVGAVLARFERPLAAMPPHLPAWADGATLLDRLLAGVDRVGALITRSLQTGQLRRYMLYNTITLLLITGVPFVLYVLPGLTFFSPDPQLRVYEAFAAALIPIAVVATIRAESRLSAIIAVGVVGAMVSLFFVLFSAPDLALTQLLIEVLSTVFLLLVFSILPARFATLSSNTTRMRDAILAGMVGLLVAGLVLATATTTSFEPLAPYYLENSLAKGKGQNVVNVILVDFRGFDTMGEVTVLLTALLGIYGLLRMRREKR